MATATGSYRDFLEAAVAISGSDAASVQIFDDEVRGLRLAGWRGFEPASASFWKLVVPESASTCGMALVTGERVIVTDVEAEPALAGSEDLNEYRRSGLRAVQSTPLVAADRVVGMISTHWRRPHAPSIADLRRIDQLARDCAEAVVRGRAHAEQEQSPRTQLLHEVNQRIREMAEKFDSLAADDPPQEYLCECGCGAWIALTGSEFDAVSADERPVEVEGHLLARAKAARQSSRILRDDAAALRAEALQKRRVNEELAKHRPTPHHPDPLAG